MSDKATPKPEVLKGSSADNSVDELKAAMQAAITGDPADQTTDSAGKTPPTGTVKEPEKFALPDGFDIKKTKEFKEMRDSLLSQMATLNDENKKSTEQLTQIQTDIQTQKAAAEKAELEKLPEADQFKTQIQNQQDQIAQLIADQKKAEANVVQKTKELEKTNILNGSELSPELYQFVNSEDPVEMKRQINQLIDKIGDAARKKLEQVAPQTQTQQVGTPVAGPVVNEGIQPSANETQTPNFDNLKKQIKDVRDLEAFFHQYPEYYNLVMGG